MKNEKSKGSLLLFLTAVIWGVAFVAQSVSMEYISPFTFNAIRCAIGAGSLVPVILLTKKNDKAKLWSKELLLGGLLCGLLLFFASNLQQVGIQYTTVGKAGFITACYIVFVPILEVFRRKRLRPNTLFAVGLAVIGLSLLCLNETFTINQGDLYMLVCSIGFAGHVMVIDYFSPKVDGVKLSFIQFSVCSLLSTLAMLLFETPQMTFILQAWMPVVYSGIMSCGVAYTLQIIGQKNTPPTVASLILSLESCVAVLAGWLLLGQQLTMRELIGCGIMFTAILLAQLPKNIVEMPLRMAEQENEE